MIQPSQVPVSFLHLRLRRHFPAAHSVLLQLHGLICVFECDAARFPNKFRAPHLQRLLQQLDAVLDRPPRKLLNVTQVPKVVPVAPDLGVQFRIADWWNRSVLVHKLGVLLQFPGKVPNMRTELSN